jgi:hypothetical protein
MQGDHRSRAAKAQGRINEKRLGISHPSGIALRLMHHHLR